MRRLPARRPFADDVASWRLVVTLGCALLTTPAGAARRSTRSTGQPISPRCSMIGTADRARSCSHGLGPDAPSREPAPPRGGERAAFPHGVRLRRARDLDRRERDDDRDERGASGDARLQRAPSSREMHFTETTHPDDIEARAQVASRRGHVGQAARRTRSRSASCTGTARVFWVAVTLTRAQDGSFGISLIDDITARKMLEDGAPPGAEDGGGRQARRRHRARLQQHDDRVSGCAEHPADEIADDDPRRERVEVIRDVGRRARRS